MISTVTTSTISTVSTIALAGSLGLIAILVLFVLLLQKEIVTASESRFGSRLSLALNIALVPLLISFFGIVIAKVAEVLS